MKTKAKNILYLLLRELLLIQTSPKMEKSISFSSEKNMEAGKEKICHC